MAPSPSGHAGSLTRYNSNGTVDESCGASGTVASLASASALLLQSDGKIVVAGSLTSNVNEFPSGNDIGFGIVRYYANGVVDSSFGRGGVAIADFGTNAPVAGAFTIAIQSNGDLVSARTAGVGFQTGASSFALARFTGIGELDLTFGLGGRLVTTIRSGEHALVNQLAIQSDGKIVAAGTSFLSGNNAYVARYLAH